MYYWSRSIVDMKMRIHFELTGSIEFIKDVSDGKVFVGKYSGFNIWISKVNTRTVTNYGTLINNTLVLKTYILPQNRFNN